MMPPRPAEYVATVALLRDLTPDVAELVVQLETPGQLTFKAGQFVNLFIPREGQKPLIRAYSIASPPASSQRLTFLIDTDVNGPGVTYLKGLKPGDSIRFKAPLGIFVLREPSDRPVIIATHVSALGTCRSLAEAALAERPDRPVTLVIEVKDEHHLFYHRELLELSRRAPVFRHVFTCPSGSTAWTGPRRMLQDETLRRLPADLEVDVYVCGLGDMVSSLKDALKKAGVPANRIVVEKWSKAVAGAEGDDT
jgi:NAD(P)H-flavin reductase